MWINVKHISFKKQRMYVELCVNQYPYYSNTLIKNILLQKFPSIANHECKNCEGKQLIDVLDSTSIPHLIEHTIIDIQSQYFAKRDIDVTLYGTTEWINCEDGKAQIQLSYYDDIVALDAVNKAISFFNNLI